MQEAMNQPEDRQEEDESAAEFEGDEEEELTEE